MRFSATLRVDEYRHDGIGTFKGKTHYYPKLAYPAPSSVRKPVLVHNR
jgi:hypothetical protein